MKVTLEILNLSFKFVVKSRSSPKALLLLSFLNNQRIISVTVNNDGCVVAANRQAKKAGIEKFKPFFQVKALCEQKGVIALSSNYELYADLSSKMMQVIGRFTPEQHIYSIDESFLSFERCYPAIPCLKTHGMKLRRAVWRECRLPVCVGFGPTLTLAKIANHAAKKNTRV